MRLRRVCVQQLFDSAVNGTVTQPQASRGGEIKDLAQGSRVTGFGEG